LPERRSFQSFHPFARLSRLLDAHPAGVDDPILLSIGEPKNQPPAFVAEEIAAAAAKWSSYPPPRGTEDAGKIAHCRHGRRCSTAPPSVS
jgi:aspartate/methionine/tyrosine aminotransferase